MDHNSYSKIYGYQRKTTEKVCQSEKIFNQHSSSWDIQNEQKYN